MRRLVLICVLLAILAGCGHGDSGPAPRTSASPSSRSASTVSFVDDFEHGSRTWAPTDPDAWKLVPGSAGHGTVYSLVRQSGYEPPHRSPVNVALLKNADVTDFTLTGDVRSTVRDYPHRDMALVFGYQDPGHFYYVHFGKTTDQYSNGIFIVNGADRVKLASAMSPTHWDEAWHRVRVERRVDTGDIRVFFDDLEKPVMTTVDRTFTWGQVGIGSFDDLGQWDNLELRGTTHSA